MTQWTLRQFSSEVIRLVNRLVDVHCKGLSSNRYKSLAKISLLFLCLKTLSFHHNTFALTGLLISGAQFSGNEIGIDSVSDKVAIVVENS